MSEEQWQRLTREWTPLEVVPSLPWWPVPCRAGFNHRNLRSQETQQKRGHKRSLFVLGSGDGCFACISINGSIRQDDEATYYSILCEITNSYESYDLRSYGTYWIQFWKEELESCLPFFFSPHHVRDSLHNLNIDRYDCGQCAPRVSVSIVWSICPSSHLPETLFQSKIAMKHIQYLCSPKNDFPMICWPFDLSSALINTLIYGKWFRNTMSR